MHGSASPLTSMDRPLFSSALSIDPDSSKAVAEAVATLREGLGGVRPDLLTVFVSHHHGAEIEGLGPDLAAATGAGVVIGCTGESIIGGSREVEREPALALWAARLPGTSVRPFAVTAAPGPDGAVFSTLPPVEDPARASLLLLADPFTFPMDDYLKALNAELPGVPAVGGMASGGTGPGQNLLLTAEGVVESGALGVVLEGDLEVRSVVSQGCRPVGKPWVVTDAQDNEVKKLGGKPALDVLMATVGELDEPDQKLFQRAPFLGLAVDANKSEFSRGDFLVRGLLGLNPPERSFFIGDVPRRGMTVQFLVRDAASAGDDLTQLMASQGGGDLSDLPDPRAAGALIFSCNGRGTRMFDKPDHDIGCVRSALRADVPVAGFFAAGEIGPVGGANFLHGFTASVFVFRPRTP